MCFVGLVAAGLGACVAGIAGETLWALVSGFVGVAILCVWIGLDGRARRAARKQEQADERWRGDELVVTLCWSMVARRLVLLVALTGLCVGAAAAGPASAVTGLAAAIALACVGVLVHTVARARLVVDSGFVCRLDRHGITLAGMPTVAWSELSAAVAYRDETEDGGQHWLELTHRMTGAFASQGGPAWWLRVTYWLGWEGTMLKARTEMWDVSLATLQAALAHIGQRHALGRVPTEAGGCRVPDSSLGLGP
jgi:hypothetical protein